ncbi:MAG TPA: F0F1 ATP synthase subunit delta [Candidatus Saccharimonadia bacterium]
MASRLQVAQELAKSLRDGRQAAVRSAAAWLVANGRQRQAQYLARDVAAVLARNGYLTVEVTAARPLAQSARAKIEHKLKALTGAHQLELSTSVDPALIGGAVIETPGGIMDTSVRTKLARYVDRATEGA